MHVFFESVWKLHIGEIPEKPDYQNCETRLNDACDVRFSCCKSEYEQAIAAIKRNALTVGNPEMAVFQPSGFNPDTKEFYFHNHLGMKDFQAKPGEFYPWPGSYEILKTLHCDEYHQHTKNSCFTTVAILTLPEEKKNTMENFKKFDLNEPHETTASGSVAAPKEEPIVNEVFYDNGEHSHLELLDHDGRIICSESELESLRDFVRDVDASLYHGPDLEDKEIMQHYIDVFKIIKEEARKLMNTYIQQTEQREEAKIIEELKVKGARSFINENTALREALKELLPIAENYRITVDNPDWEDENFKMKAIIERARKLISK